MHRNFLSFIKLLTLGLFLSGAVALAQEPDFAQSSDRVVVVSDQGASITEQELAYIISKWPPDMQQAAANSKGERLELLNASLASRKMAAEVDGLAIPSAADEAYWKLQTSIVNAKRNYLLQRHLSTLELPDMDKLARERYETDKRKYALVPEKRLTSHILFRCVAGECDRDELRPKAQEVLEQLRAGADFESMVEEYSEDPGSKARGGRFDRWMQLGELGVEPHYSGGAFEIESKGDYSDLVDTRFGLHIIRLDDMQEEHFEPYENVREDIIKDLVAEYRKLALKEFQAQFQISDDAYINGDVVDGLLTPYKGK
ncbi:peptidylprolyl isomerase [Parahaliea mediterranea]|uniref:peptidylprolyl isomerase n=1 Tax=Parahaliea mediterranea TaxID=651086 RepID=A0A939DBW2_9GAMM|nr:peptidylprolyl isomerase [Parahaliea mediterranea]MBN7795174.1 peptidylprolyl isomerase [Parahaliea mediterranea]